MVSFIYSCVSSRLTFASVKRAVGQYSCFHVICSPRFHSNYVVGVNKAPSWIASPTERRQKFGEECLAEGKERDGDMDVELVPVDVKKLALPLHLTDSIPQDIVDNIVARDRTLVFAPNMKILDLHRRLSRMKYRISVQPLGKVLHFRFFRLCKLSSGMPGDVTVETFRSIQQKLSEYTRFLVMDERWPLELSLEITPIIEHQRKQMLECQGECRVSTAEDVMELLSSVFSAELRVGAWCGLSCTPVLAKMACDECHRKHKLCRQDYSRGGVVGTVRYDIRSHKEAKEFVQNLSLGDIPVVGKPQARLLEDVYGITKCGGIADQEVRLGFSLSQSTMEFFLSVAYGTVRLPSEATTTLLRKPPRCKAAHIRRESQFGRVVSDEQFINTVMSVFDNVYTDLVEHDFVTGRVMIETRRTLPRTHWVVEESEDIAPRTSDRDLLREVTIRLARRFAPRRTEELRDIYSVGVHFGDVRSWSENERLQKKAVAVSEGGSPTTGGRKDGVIGAANGVPAPTVPKGSSSAGARQQKRKRTGTGPKPLRKGKMGAASGIRIVT
ncbi:hypothetical protein, conserved [Trypanosoma brucei gambiense DAL972]|uniref:Uncharacterized protein n=1 Tax=Trypanosoma brucei gambiense (strain MHOM/CI/86/DAL972) TaxID=679716 RepID=D0A853_TRYB9|nr:hypothetical protein, conserved [Trypanosoma brucei gambiense DAL972]CBH17854.1 hypothetical protein, conserved [Trypanosoma brucei gambiense DAL972]|eukprot:XP_011780118.1 hypothetical protein, conserved [Trypanosoma brucei gambiense DAL972]